MLSLTSRNSEVYRDFRVFDLSAYVSGFILVLLIYHWAQMLLFIYVNFLLYKLHPLIKECWFDLIYNSNMILHFVIVLTSLIWEVKLLKEKGKG